MAAATYQSKSAVKEVAFAENLNYASAIGNQFAEE